MKTCSKCKVEKPYSMYHKSVAAKDGYQGYCRECVLIANKISHEIRTKRQVNVSISSKVCLRCNTKKPISQFGKRSGAADKHLGYCKPCWNTITIAAKKRQKMV